MGITQSFKCKQCGYHIQSTIGGGFRSVNQTFEFLILNVLSRSEAIQLISQIPPTDMDESVLYVFWWEATMLCEGCNKVAYPTKWIIEFERGEDLSSEHSCEACGSALADFHPKQRKDGTFICDCPECDCDVFVDAGEILFD